MRALLQILSFLIDAIQPFLVPFCFFCAWSLVTLLAWNIFSAVKDGVATSQRMHKIPCTNCQYFTGDYRLKCTVRPSIANTEEAINCLDYQPQTNAMFY